MSRMTGAELAAMGHLPYMSREDAARELSRMNSEWAASTGSEDIEERHVISSEDDEAEDDEATEAYDSDDMSEVGPIVTPFIRCCCLTLLTVYEGGAGVGAAWAETIGLHRHWRLRGTRDILGRNYSAGGRINAMFMTSMVVKIYTEHWALLTDGGASDWRTIHEDTGLVMGFPHPVDQAAATAQAQLSGRPQFLAGPINEPDALRAKAFLLRHATFAGERHWGGGDFHELIDELLDEDGGAMQQVSHECKEFIDHCSVGLLRVPSWPIQDEAAGSVDGVQESLDALVQEIITYAEDETTSRTLLPPSGRS